MKHNLLSVLLLLCLSNSLFSKTIFVNHSAAGANDGTTWANAYTSLYAAMISSAVGDQIWVASGTYRPDGAAANGGFPLLAGVQLYGGFSGNETALTQRNPAANITILSGDFAMDDVVGVYTSGRTDNARHVIEMAASGNAADRAVVDGFTISGGQTNTLASSPDLTRRGGGILAIAKITVRNCLFTDNYGDSGSGMAAVGTAASGVLIDNCIFEANTATAASAGIFLRDLTTGEVNKCIFRNNKTNRGTAYILTSAGMKIDSCLFENNDAGANFTGGMFTFTTQSTVTNCIFRGNKAARATSWYNDGRDGGDLLVLDNCLFENNTAATFGSGFYNWQGTCELKNCIFRNNEAPNASGIYNDGREMDSNITLDNCLFESNNATNYGGTGMYIYKSNYTLQNSTFRLNKAPSAAPGIYNGDSTVCLVKGCTFDANTSPFGASVANFGSGIEATYEACTFKNNTAVTSGGAMINGFESNTVVKNCEFMDNKARFGGAIFCQNDYTGLTVSGSTFSGNAADDANGGVGGGVNVGSGIVSTFDYCLFTLNTASTGGGLVIDEDSLELSVSHINGCIFRDNFASTQAAGLNVNNADVFLTNCVFANNINLGTGAGGAISNNASGGKTSPLSLINCTLSGNVAAIGAGIAQWEDATSNSTLTLQNTIMVNSGLNYEIEDGLPEVTSNGGNLSGLGDASLLTVLLGTNDLLDADPLFVSPDDYDFHLQPSSPCRDKGVAAGAPAKDIQGGPRDATPDQGAYEFGATGTHQPQAQASDLRMAPNPAVDRTLITLESDWSGETQVRVFSQTGALVRNINVQKPAGVSIQPIDVSNLPVGIYLVRVQLGNRVYEGNLVKQ